MNRNLQNKTPLIPYICAGLFIFIISTFFRLYPLLEHKPHDASEKATILVMARIKQQVDQQIKANYPNVSEADKKKLQQKLFGQLLAREKDQLQKTIRSVTTNIEAEENQTHGHPYLLASDSFYYYDLTQNLLETGKLSSDRKGSKYLNKRMLAPNGHLEPFNLHPYIGTFVYRILKFFNPDVSLMHAVSFTPVVISSLCIIPYITLCVFFNCSAIFTFIGGVSLFLAPIFIKRSTYGWYDNDPYNIFFPLLILSILFYAVKLNKTNKSLLISAFVFALSLCAYSYFWQGWVLLFSILFASSVIFIGFLIVRKSGAPSLKNTFILFISMFVLSFVFIGLAFGKGEFFVLFKEGWVALKNFLVPQMSLWPDLYISVSELHQASLSKIISLTGGVAVFLISLLGSIKLITEMFKKQSAPLALGAITLNIFLVVSFYLTLGAQRFAFLCLIPLSILFPIGFQFLFNSITNTFKNKAFYPVVSVITIIFALSYIILPIKHIHQQLPKLLTPIYNDTWNTALEKLKSISDPKSIVNTWWSPGHFIKSTAQRAVTFDGATINKPQAYWMANVYLSPTEEEALGILRMLNVGGNKAAELLQNEGLPLSSTVQLLKKIVRYPRSKAEILLATTIKDRAKRQAILDLTHGEAPESYLLIYNELAEKNIQFKFIGHWNFKEIERINENPDLLKSLPKRNSKEYVNYLWKLAGNPYKYSGELNLINQKGDLLIFEENVIINLKDKTCVVNSDKYSKGIPFSIFYLENDEIVEKKMDDFSLSYSVILYKDAAGYHSVLLDRPLAQSLLMKAFYFKGKGLKHFTPVITESDLTKRTDISIFKVNFD